LLGDVGQRFIDRTQPSLEAQLANLADEIAYNNHDIDDGLRSGLLTIEQLQTVPIFARHYAAMMQKWPALNERRVVAETIRSMINTLITDVTQTTQTNLLTVAPANADAARHCGPLVAFSPALRAEADALKKFLFENLYRHYKVMRMTNKARRIVRALFDAFVHEPRLLPPDYRHENVVAQARAIADYIAGMTDRYAIREHHRLFRMGNQFD
jgi:dGTPase